VWVVYFSLAALPLFGLGQSLIPAHGPARSPAWRLHQFFTPFQQLILSQVNTHAQI
jgi:hypothetical protein